MACGGWMVVVGLPTATSQQQVLGGMGQWELGRITLGLESWEYQPIKSSDCLSRKVPELHSANGYSESGHHVSLMA